MRINEPVTDNEIVLAENQSLVSRTNLKGIITFVDADFIAVSGFNEDELLNKNHNIVRHPDIPAEVFDDLWVTVKAGKPWMGIVKNRCKNGDYYWIEANVTPTYQRGRVTGFLSVRRKASKEQIDAASELYAGVHAGTRSYGDSQRISSLDLWNKMTLKAQLVVQLLGVAGMFALLIFTAQLENVLLFAAATVGSIGLMVGILVWFSRRVLRPMTDIVKILRGLAEGEYFNSIEIKRGDEVGGLLRSLKSVQIKLGSDIDEARNNAARATQIRRALDNVSTSAMVSNARHEIVYMNDSAMQLFEGIEEDIQQDITGFKAASVLGSNIDIFHKDPAHQRALLDKLESSHTAVANVGGRTLQIIVNPVLGDSGERIGTAMEWKDLTAELAIEEDVQRVVDAAMAGDLGRRIPLDDKQGFLAILSKNINELVGVSERAINDTARVLAAVSHGDLTETIDNDYSGLYGDLKRDANETVAQLSKVVKELQEAAQSVNTGADEIAQGNTDLSRRTEEQAASLEETASSMEEMNATVRQNAENAANANQLAKAASEQADMGGEIVGNAVSAMNAINASSSRIADIVGVIDDIAFQTNLLALNASVEAARAGEQGRGFAVVASEVRNLASRSASAAKEIKDLIKDSVSKVDDGSRLVNESGEMLGEIVTGIKKVTDIVGEIAAASQEQATGIDEINRAVAHMDGLTQQNASLVEEAAAASGSLGDQAQKMQQLTYFFDLGDDDPSRSDEVETASNGMERRSSSRPWTGDRKAKSHTTRQVESLDFASARTKHLSWKTRLRGFLDGKESLTEEQAVSHRDCDLGKWLYGKGLKKYGQHTEMQELERIHAEMHSIIRDIISHKTSGDDTLAEKAFSKIGPLSETIIGLLTELEAIVKSSLVESEPSKSATGGGALASAGEEWEEF